MEKYKHNPNYRMKYPGKEFYVFSKCKQNSFPWQHPDFKPRKISPGPVNFIPDRDHDEKPEEKEEVGFSLASVQDNDVWDEMF